MQRDFTKEFGFSGDQILQQSKNKDSDRATFELLILKRTIKEMYEKKRTTAVIMGIEEINEEFRLALAEIGILTLSNPLITDNMGESKKIPAILLIATGSVK